MTTALAKSIDLTDAQFEQIRRLIKRQCGIHLNEGKKDLVRGRLAKRLRVLGFDSFRLYLEHLDADASGSELTALLDAISTNQTSFFREPAHFEYLQRAVLPRVAARGDRRLRVWSAGCSSGEEPYSIAITLREGLGELDAWDARVLATDISTRVLAGARRAVYGEDRVAAISPLLRSRYFVCTQTRPRRQYGVVPAVRKLVHFARLNLMDSWPMRGPFDVIFCRNVMIYFDRPTRQRLIGRFAGLLAKGGTLFVGHSESLTGIQHPLRYVQPTVYEASGRQVESP